MDPRTHRMILVNVTDQCNFRCSGCHWFSSTVVPSERPLEADDVASFLTRTGPYDRAIFSGGEPSLWEPLPDVVNQIRTGVAQFAIYTNGSMPDRLAGIVRSGRSLYLRISVHSQTDWRAVRETVALARSRSWAVKVFAYRPDFDHVGVPGWLDVPIKVNEDQNALGASWLGYLKGKRVMCRPRMIFIGSDGKAYACERGMRSKDTRLALDFSVWSGTVSNRPRSCIAESDCLSCFVSEQFVIAEGLRVPKEIEDRPDAPDSD